MAGNDTLRGGAGNDTYVFGRGDGIDRIVESDTTLGNHDLAVFGEGISQEQLWFRRSSNNLEVSVIGSADKLILQNWYLGEQYRVEEFQTADGSTLLDGQVQNLVDAMAAFAPPSAGQTTLPDSYKNALESVIATNWQ
ncbi:Bifunctional hemolysin/adenylate cyclase [compost metagenome]